MRPGISWIIIVLVLATLFTVPLSAQEDSTTLQQVAEQLNDKVAQLSDEVSMLWIQLTNQQQNTGSQSAGYGSIGLVLFLSGAFCALWAQDSGRRPWFWFVVGFIFPLLTVIALLVKNSEDIKSER
jgi:hypothetical protein